MVTEIFKLKIHQFSANKMQSLFLTQKREGELIGLPSPQFLAS